MSYQKQNFANGEVLTASQLNHIENGITDVESTANATKGVVDKIIDPTLSVPGKAADAAKVGEAVGQLKEDLDVVNTVLATKRIKSVEIQKNETFDDKFMNVSGTIVSLESGSKFSLCEYKVEANKAYILYGENISFPTDATLVGFKNTSGSTGYVTEKIVTVTTNELKDYNILYEPSENGYLYIAYRDTLGEIKLYSTKKDSDRLIEVEESINKTKEDLDVGYVKDLAVAKNATYDDKYVKPNGAISSAGTETPYHLNEYKVSAGQTYIIYGDSITYPISAIIVGFKEDVGITGVLTKVIEVTANDTKDYNILYTPAKNGYLYIAYRDTLGEIGLFTTFLDSKRFIAVEGVLNKTLTRFSNLTIYCMGDSILDDVGSWGHQLANRIGAKKVVNVGRGGCTWADRANQIDYNENCPIWNLPLRKKESADHKTTYFDHNPSLDACVLPYNNVNYTSMSNCVRFMSRLIAEFEFPSPDIIVIGLGVNDSRSYTINYSDEEFSKITSTSISDMTDEMKKTIGGGIRWTIESLMNKYPAAEIIVATPIQSALAITNPYILEVCKWIEAFSCYYSCKFIDAYNHSGISKVFEHDMAEGRYTRDGVHPNDLGKTVHGKYMAMEIMAKSSK